MTFIEKFSGLTLEQKEKLKTVKDAAGLETFLSETGLVLTRWEKAEVLDYFANARQLLSDEELEKVAAGGVIIKPPKTEKRDYDYNENPPSEGV